MRTFDYFQNLLFGSAILSIIFLSTFVTLSLSPTGIITESNVAGVSTNDEAVSNGGTLDLIVVESDLDDMDLKNNYQINLESLNEGVIYRSKIINPNNNVEQLFVSVDSSTDWLGLVDLYISDGSEVNTSIYYGSTNSFSDGKIVLPANSENVFTIEIRPRQQINFPLEFNLVFKSS